MDVDSRLLNPAVRQGSFQENVSQTSSYFGNMVMRAYIASLSKSSTESNLVSDFTQTCFHLLRKYIAIGPEEMQ